MIQGLLRSSPRALMSNSDTIILSAFQITSRLQLTLSPEPEICGPSETPFIWESKGQKSSVAPEHPSIQQQQSPRAQAC